LIVGTGMARLPVMDEVKREAGHRKIALRILPTAKAIEMLNRRPKDTNTILHITANSLGKKGIEEFRTTRKEQLRPATLHVRLAIAKNNVVLGFPVSVRRERAIVVDPRGKETVIVVCAAGFPSIWR
jgi:hypothetical protein